MGFRCRMCGTCCMPMGDYIAIEQQLGPFIFACELVSTGTPFMAIVDEDKRQLFLDMSWITRYPTACRFLRPRGEHIVCTIHGTRPILCMFYRCEVMRIFDRRGALIGKVTGTLALHSEDKILRGIWEKAIEEIQEGFADVEEKLREVLEAYGYLVE